MPPSLCYGLALLLLLTAGSCKKETSIGPATCAPTSAVVKTVTATEGRVVFYPSLQQYVVLASSPTTIRSQDVGVLCTPLPTALQVDGLPVRFSGTYTAYPAVPSSGDLIYYYLNVNTIEPK